MGHKTLINGTAYGIKGGRALIGGTGYGIKSGKTLIGGTGYSISFGKPLSGFTTGSIVKLNESGVPAEFYVAQHNYYRAYNGAGKTLLVRKDCLADRVWLADLRDVEEDNWNNYYGDSDISTWLAGPYAYSLDASIRSAANSRVECIKNGDRTVTIGAKVFLLSMTELGESPSSYDFTEGEILPIASLLKTAKRNGSSCTQWTRSPSSRSTEAVFYMTSSGSATWDDCTTSKGVRPVLALPDSTLVSDSGLIT